MPDRKIAVIGAGSFVFGPSMLSQLILDHDLPGAELALIDVDADLLDLMAGVGRRMIRERGRAMTITAHTNRDSAFEGADFVVCAAAREMHKRFEMDRAAIRQHYPDHLITEFGGVAGISYSLRQIELLRQITDDMKRFCPDAWFLTVSNPLPRVCQATHENGVKTVGFCSVAMQVYGLMWQIFEGTYEPYPFAKARERWQITTAGLNHFSWVIEFRDRATGEDMLPALHAKIEAGALASQPLTAAVCRETGYLVAPGDDHIRDFLPPMGEVGAMEEPSHGTLTDRRARLALLRAIGEGSQPWDVLLEHPSWERPGDLIASLMLGTSVLFPALNLINTGQIADLPGTVCVETPAASSAAGIVPQPVNLPGPVLERCQQTARVTDTIVRAALERDRAQIDEAVRLDPTVLDKDAGKRAMAACLAAHADILAEYV